VPILYIDGKPVLGQSKAIERFLAQRFGLYGANDVEGAQVDMIGEHVRDIKDAYGKAKAAGNADAFLATDLPKWLQKLESCVKQTGTPGYAVGNKLSLAGLQIYSLCVDFFDNKEAAAAATKTAPAVAAIVDNVANNDKLKAWLASRPVTMF
jgi:glutathione S-transferase